VIIKFDLFYNKIILSMEIQGYPDYLIYEDGRIWVKKIKGRKEGYMKPQKHRLGYLQIKLTNETGRDNFLIHRLVAIHYIPNPLNLSFVDHIDRDVTNNNISNLRWVTHQENMQNKTIRKDNKCGIKNISYLKNIWRYEKIIRGNKFRFSNKNKNIVLWCKFIYETLPVETGA